MKNSLKTVVGIMAMTAVSMSLEAAVFADISSDDRQQKRSQVREMMSGIDELDEKTVDSVSQSQRTEIEMPSPTTSEAFLEQVYINSRQQAAEAAYNLSIIATSRNDLALARTHIEESIKLNDVNTNYLTYAADIAFITQEYNKAEGYLVMVLELVRSALEHDDLQVAVILDQLGSIYVAQELYEKANSCLQESLHLREKLLGYSHLQIVVSLNKLASVAVRQENPTVAESLLKRSLDITREVSGLRHANRAAMLANLADLYLRETRLEEAEELYEEAISIWADSPGDPLRQAIGQNSLGQLFLSQHRFDDARIQFEQVLFLLMQNYRQDHPYVQQAKRNLTALDAERGSNVEEERMYDGLVREFSKHYVNVNRAIP